MASRLPDVVNVADVEEKVWERGEHWGAPFKVLTPTMREQGGKLGVNQTRLRPGRVTVPFHFHMLEDEVFYILSGRGVLRYGEDVVAIGPGDCISCPAGNKKAHQIANPYDEDLVYLSIGPHEPNEVCVYPDTGKVLVRNLKKLVIGEDKEYFDDEPDPPKILSMTPEE